MRECKQGSAVKTTCSAIKRIQQPWKLPRPLTPRGTETGGFGGLDVYKVQHENVSSRFRERPCLMGISRE